MIEPTPVTTPDNARNEDQKRIIQEFLEKGEDPFKYENFITIPGNEIVKVTPDWYAFKNQWPYKGAEHHVTIVSKRNIATIEKLLKSEVISLYTLQAQLIEEFGIKGGAFCMRFGDPILSGTTVTRLHGHLFGPHKDETITFHIGQFKNLNK